MEELNVKLQGGHTNSALCVDAKSDGSRIISGGEDGEICLWTRDGTLSHKLHGENEDCTGVYISRTKESIFYASLGNTVKVFDSRNIQSPVESYQFNEEEIDQIVLDEKEGFLAACDDSGDVKIISLQEKRLYKTLRRKHTNICATVCFRVRKPWEIFSGGMDCNLIHWDFSRPKCLNQFNMQELQDAPSDLGAYMVNPPFVHNLSMSPDGKYLACALENGFVSVFDASKKNIAEMCTLHAHTQGVSQVDFVSSTKLLTGGNDCTVASWDLSKMNSGEDASTHAPSETNGHSSPIHSRNSQITENCKLSEIQHSSKINWMKNFSHSGNHFVVLADQSPDLTVLPIQI
ncbi:WD repeat-containing protein 53-like isoform X2 [Ruditapes philippinarum]|nr:WD repeat-containing protein 53-like isoform X2 [Ruditapes philippinarum]XP_060578097.1 WD repeat-containing protein 53-like isoform X2 [Ruditapes philippinarum]XP_060578105.1 WD repeat-containing protein 53-like isoform X2 [Ruditapes philippinarum]XP_060578113.1 WD repeat-containing protein 53-like isoform X2 [Ruditapes philippinarum]